MYKWRPSTSNVNKDPKEYKNELRKYGQVTQTSQKKHPLKAPISVERELPIMGNNVWNSKSKNEPTESSKDRRASRPWERNSPATSRSVSQNRELRKDPPENCSSLSSERFTKVSGCDNHGVLAHHTRHISTDGLGYPEISRTVTGSKDSSHGRPGVHPGVGATLLRDANSSKTEIGTSAYQSYVGLSGSSDVRGTYATTFTKSSDSNDRSNDGSWSPATDRSGASRLQSGSQQPEQRQHYPANYANLSPVKNTRRSDYDNDRITASQIYDPMAYSSTLGTGNPENRSVGGTVSGSSVSSYRAGAGVDGANSKAKTGQSEYQSYKPLPGSSDVASIHTSATNSSGPSDANSKSTGRESRPRGRTGASGLRSASQGLRNLGNTCYMNSILQCLAKVPWFKDRPHLKFRDDLLNEFFGLMKKMEENDSDASLDPYQFRKQISALGFRFSSSEQNDAHEFLLCLLSRLSKTLKSERKPDLVADFLLGKQQNVITFKECEHVLINEQPFFSLSLPLTAESGKSVDRSTIVELQQCLENYTKIEDVDGDALCMDCQAKQRKAMQPCSIEASLKCLPKFLMIHLKRYDFMRAEKLENKVLFPHEKLEIKRKEVDQSGKVVGREEVVVYDLIAVCNHYGSLRFGHYTADIKSPSNWYNYSDSRVRQTPSEEIGFSRAACILFYQQSD